MAYLTQAELLKRTDAISLAKLASDQSISTLEDANGELQDADVQAVITQAIADAEREINLYVLGHLDTSDSDTQDSLEWMSAYLALYNLHQRRSKSDENNDYRDKRAQIIEQLREINKRTLHVDDDPLSPAQTSHSTVSSVTRVFGRKDATDSPMEHF